MTFNEFKRSLLTPYWVDNPLEWVTQGAGIAFLAQAGRVGMFNLALLVLDCEAPPPAQVYRERNLQWVLQVAPVQFIGARSLEHHASLKTLPDFCRVLQAVSGQGSPYQQLYLAGLKRITYDIRHRRTAG